MLGSIGLPELLVILLIVLVIFGAGKIPQVGKGLGEGIRNFKDAIKDGAGEKSGPKDKDSGPQS